MTTADERTRSIFQTTQFLQELTWSDATPGVPDAVRSEARRLMRHFPAVTQVNLVALALHLHFAPVLPQQQGATAESDLSTLPLSVMTGGLLRGVDTTKFDAQEEPCDGVNESEGATPTAAGSKRREAGELPEANLAQARSLPTVLARLATLTEPDTIDRCVLVARLEEFL